MKNNFYNQVKIIIMNFEGGKIVEGYSEIQTLNEDSATILCRACLGSNENTNLFNLTYDEAPVSEIFEVCTSIQIEQGCKGMPEGICKMCLTELMITYSFIKKCQELDVKLKLKNVVEQDNLDNKIAPIEIEILDKDSNNSADEDIKEIITLDVTDEPEYSPNGATTISEASISEMNHNSDDVDDIGQETCPRMPYICGLCEEGFLERHTLEKHEQMHNAQKSAICPHCGKFSKNLRQHIRISHSPKLIRCEICKTVLNSAEALRKHLKMHNNSFVCPFCQKSLSGQDKLNEHINMHTGHRPFACNLCDKKFKQKNTLNAHLTWHQGIKRHVCNKCGKRFLQKSHLTHHMRIHLNIHPFSCSSCGKNFRWLSSYKKHKCSKDEEIIDASGDQTNHSFQSFNPLYDLARLRAKPSADELPYNCRQCDGKFSNLMTAKCHLLEEHQLNYESNQSLLEQTESKTAKKSVVCEICNVECSNKQTLKYHTMRHTGVRPHVCDFCGKGFIQKHSFIEHRKKHTGETPYVCKYCTKGFRSASSYKEHIAIHLVPENPVECATCRKVMRSMQAWKRHQLTHNKRFLCNECGRNFPNITQLNQHINNIHKGIRPFACELCHKSFYLQSELKKHELRHADVKPHSCEICRKTFLVKNKLVDHINKVHFDLQDTLIKDESC